MGKYDHLIAGSKATTTPTTSGKYDYLVKKPEPAKAKTQPAPRGGALGGLQEVVKDVTEVVRAPYPKQEWNPMRAFDSATQNVADTLTDTFNRYKKSYKAYQNPNASIKEKAIAQAELSMGLVNTALSPITASLQGAAKLPVIGSVAETINRFFGVLGTVGGDVGEGAVEALPVSDKTKEAIKPLAIEVGALVAQIAGGKGGLDKVKILREKSKVLAETIDKDVTHQVRIVSEDTGAVQIPIKTPKIRHEEYAREMGYEPYTLPDQLPIIRMGDKPKASLPTIQMDAPKRVEKLGELTVEPINEKVARVPESTSQETLQASPKITPVKSDPLITEARKYKSAEEFVASNEVFYRGQPKGEGLVTRNGGSGSIGNGMMFNSSPSVARMWSDNVQEFAFKSNANVKRFAGSKDLMNEVYDWAETTKGSIYRNNTETNTIIDAWAKANKIDGIHLKGSDGVVFNQDAVLTKSQLTDIWKKAQESDVSPIKAEQVPNTRAQTLEKAAVEKKLTDSLGELPTHERMSMADQAARALDFIEKNPEQAMKVIRGEAVPDGVLPEALYTAMEIKAIKNGDVAMLKELSNSTIPTTAGQAMKALDSADPNSPVKIMRDIQQAREAKIEKRTGKKKPQAVKEVVDEIKREVQKSVSKRPSWEEFLKEIQCK